MNSYTILIPHFKVPKLIYYTIHQFLKCAGNHNVEIIVINNSYPDSSIDILKPFGDKIKIIDNTSTKVSSHGIAFDEAIKYVSNEHVITAENDSFPTKENWLSYYDELLDAGAECAGSLLQLSGGQFIHPTGMLLKKSIYYEAMEYVNKMNEDYAYFPNICVYNGFATHLMVRRDILDDFISRPSEYIEVSDEYKNKDAEYFHAKLAHYEPVCGVFHNAMGRSQEELNTYGKRNVDTEPAIIILDNKEPLIRRMGYEPGQWLSYYQIATGKKVFAIPTETKWLPGRVNQNQEYTLMENGFKHLWGCSSYSDFDSLEMRDVITAKRAIVEELYNSITNQ